MPIRSFRSKSWTARHAAQPAAAELLERRQMLAADLAASLSYRAGTYYPEETIADVMLNEINVGDQAAATFSTRIFLSTNAILGDADDVSLLQVDRAGNDLAAGQLSRSSRTLGITSAMPAGRYFVIVKTDSAEEVNESIESNNIWVSAAADVVIARAVVSVTAVDQAASEANTNTGRFRFTRTGPVTAPLRVTYTAGGAAVAGTDYVALSGSVTIPASQASAFVNLRPIDDSDVESGEQVSITLATDAAYTVAAGAGATARVNISDNDGARVQIIATDGAAAEAGQGTATFTVSRAGNRNGDLTVRYSIAGTAQSGADYTALPGEVTIPSGDASVTITLTPVDDDKGENPETVILTLLPSPGVTIVASRKSARATIADNEPVVKIAATDASATETGPGLATFTVTRVGTSTEAIMVTYTVSGTAVSGTDFVPLSGSVIIPAGSLSAPITLTPIDDIVAEGMQNVIVTLNADDGYRLDTARKRATANIADNEPTVGVTASDASASENNNGTGTFTFTRSGTPTGVLITKYTISGTAAAGTDYQVLDGTVTFAAGSATATVVVTPINDLLGEGSEQVVVTLAARPAYNRNASKTTARITITDNEPSVSITALDGAAAENDGPVESDNIATFRVTRTGSTVGSITIPYTVTGSAAHDGADYATLSGTVTINDGDSSATIDVTPIDDAVAETGETVIVTLGGNVGYLLSNSRKSATVTIADNEPVASIVASDAAATEAGSGAAAAGAVKVTRAGSTSNPLTVYYTIAGTATNGDDYQTIAGSVTILAGEADAIITITPLQDLKGEGDEAIEFTLTDHATYTVLTAGNKNKARVTIKDDEPIVSIVATDNAATELDATDAVFTLTRTGSSDQLQSELTVRYRVEGSAQAGDDYELIDGEVTFASGAATAVVRITAIDDAEGETNETVVLTIDGEDDPAYAIDPAKASASATIADNEPVVSIVATDSAAGENANPGVFTVRRTGSTADELVVTYTIAGTATSGTDYTALTGTVTIEAGQATATITVTPIYDLLVEMNEMVELTLNAPDADSGFRLDTAKTAKVTIANAPAVDLNLQSVSYFARSYSLASTGLQSSIVANFANLGPTVDGNSGGFSVEFRLSLNDTWGDSDDVVIGTVATGSLAGGGAATITFTFDFDAVKSRLSTGSYYLGTRIDSASRVIEANEGNNTRFSSMADIVVVD